MNGFYAPGVGIRSPIKSGPLLIVLAQTPSKAATPVADDKSTVALLPRPGSRRRAKPCC